MSDPKRRLGLLPEILPAPPTPSPDGPRGRTVAHMQRLLVMASTAAMIEGCDKGSLPGYGVVDPMPPPAKCNPPFDATATVARDGNNLTVVIETHNASALRQGPPTLGHGAISSSKVEGNKLTVVFAIGDDQSWALKIPASCGGTDVNVTISVSLNEGKQPTAFIIQPYE